MKKVFKLVTIFSLAVCCLLAAAGCNNPANEFAGEYEKSDYEKISILDILNEKPVTEEMKSDANLAEAINSMVIMVGTKVKLAAGYVLFKDSDTKFNIKSYDLYKPIDSESQTYENNMGFYEIETNDENLEIIITAGHNQDGNGMMVEVLKYATALDGKDYCCHFAVKFKTGETK